MVASYERAWEQNEYQPLMSNDGSVVIVDNSFTSRSDPNDTVLAYELGHVLFLGHGNGLDDPVGNPPYQNERYDGFCDHKENENAAPFTLMKPKRPVTENLTDLQRANARTVARVTVGGVTLKTGDLQNGYIISDDEVDQVGEVKDPSVDLRSLGIHYNTIRGVTILSYRLVGRLPNHSIHRFLAFADLDVDPATGFMPNRKANIFIDHRGIGSTVLDEKGTLSVRLKIPQDGEYGVHLIVVAETKKALTAHCSLKIIREDFNKNASS